MSALALLGERIGSLKLPGRRSRDSPSPSRGGRRPPPPANPGNETSSSRLLGGESTPPVRQHEPLQRQMPFGFHGAPGRAHPRIRAVTISDPSTVPCKYVNKMEYIVKDTDTLERIAALHECTVGELMKMNRLCSRMVFPGQTLVVPTPVSDDVFEDVTEGSSGSGGGPSSLDPQRGPTEKENAANGGTEIAPDGIAKADANLARSVSKTQSAPLGSSKAQPSSDADADCLQRFLKVRVKHVTENDGTVSGTLLVTPNALMFDPDVMHPLVKENGHNLYMMVANMDEIMSVAVFKDIGALTGEMDKHEKMYDPNHLRKPGGDSEDEATENGLLKSDGEKVSPLIEADDSASERSSDFEERDRSPARPHNFFGSDSQLPLIAEEDSRAVGSALEVPRPTRRTLSDVGPDTNASFDSKKSKKDLQKEVIDDARANSIRGSAGKVTQSAVSGTKTMAHGVVSHTKSAADTLHTGIQTSAKMAKTHAKVAVDAMVNMPQGIVNIGTGLFVEGQHALGDAMVAAEDTRTVASMRREKSLATLESLKQKTQQAREQLVKERETSLFTCATTPEDKPDLFRPVHELMRKVSEVTEPLLVTELPYYMAVRLDRKKSRTKTVRSTSRLVSEPTASSAASASSAFEETAVGNRVRREFWFAIPRERAHCIYHFLLQWNPEKYGQDSSATVDEAAAEDTSSTAVSGYSFGDNGFIVLDSDVDDKLAGEKPATPLFGSSYLNREWEIVTVREVCRRLSLDRLDQLVLPIPDGATSSQILDEAMIRQIMEILPARAEGYPWVNIYNSEKHGFSLFTLYRKMQEWDEEMSPILLVIRDCNDCVFGAVASTALVPCDHFKGTGDSCLLFKFTTDPQSNEKELLRFPWTGENQFFVKASKDSLSMGAGGGHYGLWLDADLNHGRSMRCETFDNEPLSNDEDFNVQFVEAYGFRMA